MVNTILARRVNHIVAKGDNPAWPKGSKSRGFSTLNRNAALFKMLIEMASLKHLEEQGKTAKRGYLIVYELYVTISHQIL